MPPQTDSALPTRLSSISNDLHGRKLRVVGRVLSYDSANGCILLEDEKYALVVDVTLCIDPFKEQAWLRDRKEAVMVFGYLERLEVSDFCCASS
ncbi:hypothetical protein NEOLEDRAFT_1059228 [Neolentinus lepideus HHB14362 ss-1]|uniref:Replication factor A protein 3 n=1 Tax=Neolentinus lepideus HHB14362 ss-1 TaxID=1314782 RepID=A0A165UD11_9AGAM|nr:hypothetical protein NEOLEDRAFT_1059228 [Neolentinus lepideus HHB14362 ss-1]